MSWLESAGAAALGAVGGGVASAYGGYIAARKQEELASVAAAKLIVAELLRNQIRLQEFAEANPMTRRVLSRSMKADRSAWQAHSAALTRFVDNETFAECASAYVHAELAEIPGGGLESQRRAIVVIQAAVARLTQFIEEHEARRTLGVGCDLQWRSPDRL